MSTTAWCTVWSWPSHGNMACSTLRCSLGRLARHGQLQAFICVFKTCLQSIQALAHRRDSSRLLQEQASSSRGWRAWTCRVAHASELHVVMPGAAVVVKWIWFEVLFCCARADVAARLHSQNTRGCGRGRRHHTGHWRIHCGCSLRGRVQADHLPGHTRPRGRSAAQCS